MAQEAKTLKDTWKQKLKTIAARNDGYVTIDQLAGAIGVCRTTISNAITYGKIKNVIKTGEDTEKVERIEREVIDAYIEKVVDVWKKRVDAIKKNWITKKDLYRLLRLPAMKVEEGKMKVYERATNHPIMIPLQSAHKYIDGLPVLNEETPDSERRPDGLRQLSLFPAGHQDN